MSTRKSMGLGLVLIQIALGLFFIASGIMTLQLEGGFLGRIQAGFGGNEVATAVYSILNGNVANIVIIAIGVCELLAGIFLILRFFMGVGKLADVVLIVIMVVWIVVIVLTDILGNGGLLKGALSSFGSIISFLKVISSHLLVLGGILLVKRG
ncbi:MAG: hypothetical protein IKK79_01785 [Spirochaetaceae bacterium]|nr:hypothetical protein [Spirochaetaceae bacterium]MBR6565521.1 hypothetical protein [Spirochaetaceae bacterium]